MRTLSAMTAAAVLLATSATADAQTASQRAEESMASGINAIRAQHGLPKLRRASSLFESAGRFSRWLMDHDTFGHLSSIQASSQFAMLGEALAMHSGRRFKVRGTLSQWMGSPSHRAIVLSPVMRYLGTGVTRGRFGAMPATVWVLHVGKLAPGAPSLPVPKLPLP